MNFTKCVYCWHIHWAHRSSFRCVYCRTEIIAYCGCVESCHACRNCGQFTCTKTFVMGATFNPIYLGMAFSVAGSLFIEKLRTVYKHYQELAIPIILSGGIGLSVILFHLRMASIPICFHICSEALAR